MSQIDHQALSKGMSLLNCFRETTGNGEMQVQTMLTFLYVASRHPNPVPMLEIEKTLGYPQTTNSRNVRYWSMTSDEVAAAARKRNRGDESAKSAIKSPDAAGMFKVEVDPFYVKRKLVTLTPRGEKFAANLSKVLRA